MFLVLLKQTDDKEIIDQWTHFFNQISTESNIRFFWFTLGTMMGLTILSDKSCLKKS